MEAPGAAFWSALTALPETSTFKQAATDNLAAAQQSNTQNWAARLSKPGSIVWHVRSCMA